MLGRIASACVNTSEHIGGKLNNFFVEKLNFRKVEVDVAMLTYENITKKLYLSDEDGIFTDEEGEDDFESEEEEMDE